MTIVVDTSVVIAVMTNEPEKQALIGLTRGADLLSACSLKWEVGNAFSAMLRRNRVTLEQSLEALKVYQRIPIRLVDVELAQALQVANQLNIYAYDAYMICAAQRHRCPLLSLDQRLIRSAKTFDVEVLEV